MVRWLLLLVCTGCSGGAPDAEPVLDTDVEEEACDVARIDRPAFEEEWMVEICYFWDTCPGDAFPRHEDCFAHLRLEWNLGGCWDSCQAGACAAWLESNALCEEDGLTLPPACAELAPGCE